MANNSDDRLPTLATISKWGWNTIYNELRDDWNQSDRFCGKIVAAHEEIDFVRYNRPSERTNSVIINHGGPNGTRHEGWRYFFDPEESNLLFPLQYNKNSNDRIDPDKIYFSGGLDYITNKINQAHRSMLSGKAMIIGSSWGGTVSLAYASMYPELISSVIVISPFIPTAGALNYIINRDGGFADNIDLYRFFMDGIYKTNDEIDYKKIFNSYADALRKNNRNILRQFSALMYAAMGDQGASINPDTIPQDAISIERALAFCYMAGHKKPFMIDENMFFRGLKSLKNRQVPVHIISPRDDNTKSERELKSISEMCGAHVHKVAGGHSSNYAKLQMVRILKSTRTKK